MVYLAKWQKKVSQTTDIQNGLGELAQSDEFTSILHQEVEARKLDVIDVMACVDHLYDEVSSRTNGNDDTVNDIIIVRTTKFNENERAALVIFLKLQGNWPNPLDWREGNIKGRKNRGCI